MRFLRKVRGAFEGFAVRSIAIGVSAGFRFEVVLFIRAGVPVEEERVVTDFATFHVAREGVGTKRE